MARRESGAEVDRSILDKLPPKEVHRQRTWRGVLRDAWMALRGKTYLTMRGYCFHCKQEFHVEAYQDCVFPIRPRCGCRDPVNLDMMRFNAAGYFPTELMRSSPSLVLEAKTGDHLTIEEAKELEKRVGYGSGEAWWEKDTIQNIQDRAAVRREHQEDAGD